MIFISEVFLTFVTRNLATNNQGEYDHLSTFIGPSITILITIKQSYYLFLIKYLSQYTV